MIYKPAAVLSKEMHQEKVREWWKLEVVIDSFAYFVSENQQCHYCRKPSNVPHHLYLEDYHSLDLYLSALFTSRVIPLCNSCHDHIHSGWVECPECGTRLMRQGYDQCYTCYLKEKEEIDKYKWETKDHELRIVKCPHCSGSPFATVATERCKCINPSCRMRFNPNKNVIKLR